MDKELKHLKLNISQIAALSGVHRQTASARLNHLEPVAGNSSNLKLYALTDILSEMMKAPAPVENQEMLPQDRKAWYQSERERLKFEQEVGSYCLPQRLHENIQHWLKRWCKCWKRYLTY